MRIDWRYFKGGELAVAALLVAILGLMILPLPPLLIDLLLSVNIAISILLLMVALYAPSLVSLSAFPSMLLFTTLFRLALNIATSKAILLHAEAGHIVDAFGHLVVGGNLVVGLVVFLIIAVVQFIVIAKGSERSSEVSARFALDALPGQQMSIDAEQRAGSITGEEAQRKRALLAMESQVLGGMDGAMKFVKGDAIAGLAITVVNIVAGIAVGAFYHAMSMGEAAQRFAVLSVGDGMVSQIPSLLVSVAAGVLTTRVADRRLARQLPLGQEIVGQLLNDKRALFITAALLGGFSLIPGFPMLLFVGLGILLVLVARSLGPRADRTPDDASRHGQEEDGEGSRMPALRGFGAKGDGQGIARTAPAFSPPIGLRLSPALHLQISARELDRAVEAGRRRLEEEFGLPFPGMGVWVAHALEGLSCELVLQDVPAGRLDVPAGHVAVEAGPPDGGRPMRPVDGVPGICWAPVAAAVQRLAIESLIARHMTLRVAEQAHLFVGIQETQWIMDRLNQDYQGLTTEVLKVVPLQRIADVLRRLLEEQVPIRAMRNILESLVHWGPKEKDVLLLTEYVRGDLGRMIAHRASQGSARLDALFLDIDVEQQIRQAIKPTPTGNFLALPQDDVVHLVSRIEAAADAAGGSAERALALVTSMDVRRYVRKMIQPTLPGLQVYSFQELGSHLELVPMGQVNA